MRLPLSVEVAAARAVGRLSRLAGRGGGTTIPGKLLTIVDPRALHRLAARLAAGSVVVSATNGKTTTAAMAAAIFEGRFRLAHNSSGANLASGIASTLVAAEDAELGLFEVDEGALPQVARALRPRVLCLGNLFRDQLDRYGELERVADRWRALVAELGDGTSLVINGDDPQLGEIALRAGRACVFGVDDPQHGTATLQHAADSKWCVRCGTPYVYAVAYVGHLGDYRCPRCGHARPSLEVVAREIELQGLDGVAFTLVTPEETRRIRLPLPGLYNVYNALAAASLARTLGLTMADVAAGLEHFRAAFGRFERIPIGDRGLLVLLIKNPAGANEAVRTLVSASPPRRAVIALNDAIADGRDVSWIWDVDFEPLLESLEHLIATGDRAAELALRFKYAGFDESRIEVRPDLADALDRGVAATVPGDELVVLPTYTAMLRLRKIVGDRGYVRPYWEAAA